MGSKNIAIALEQFTTFGDLLKYLRRRAGLTQRELSIAVGYSDTQISRLEQNERLPDLATLTARFLPVLHLDDQPEAARRMLELAAHMRREDAPAVGLPPYKGLQYFEETDAELFVGRDSSITLLLDLIAERLDSNQRILAIIGASGSGKSSLVRAGLVPALRWRQLSSAWPVLILTPSAHPLETLAASLTRETQHNQPIRKLVDEFERDPGALNVTLNRLALSAGAAHAILVVDQFEELFTLCRSETEQAAFVENLVSAAYQPGGLAIIVIVLRADFYAYCARFSLLRQAISRHQEYIGPMTNEELRSAIEEPARRGHWDFEPGLVNLILHDIGADAGHTPEPGALPLLSHALLATWQRRRGRILTLSGYSATGGVRGAIAETAEAVFYDQLGPEQREVARQIFLRLTELGGETSTADTRRRVTFEELVSKPNSKAIVQEVLLTLADARLITTDQNSAEVAHEALIREWPTLRGWLEEDREGLRLHRRLTEAALEWNALDRDPGVLYRGARLLQALEWSHAHPGVLNQLELDFIDTSQRWAEKEKQELESQRQRELETALQVAEAERARAAEQSAARQRMQRVSLILTVAMVTVVLLAVSVFLLWQRAINANHLAISRELAAAAITNIQVDPERSALLALRALEESDNLEARNALHQALPEMHVLMNIPAHSGGVPDVAYSPDGALIASIGGSGEVKLWEATTGKLIRVFEEITDENGGNIAFSPDGNSLAVGWETLVVLFNVQTGEISSRLSSRSVGTTVGYNLGVGQISFSPDGQRLAVANMEGSSKIWELGTQREVFSLQLEEMQPPKAIAYSPDGERIALGGDEGIVTVWDAHTGEVLFMLTLGGIIHSVSFSPDSIYLAAASEDGSAKVWETVTGKEAMGLPRLSGLYDIAFLADGRFATGGQDGTVRVWDTATGQQQLTLAGSTSTVISVAGSPDGQRIASGGYDGSLRIWDVAPGRELLTIPAHDGIVWNTAFTPDRSRLASASVDGFVRLWDPQTGKMLFALPPGDTPGAGFTSLAFSLDGSHLAAGGIDGTITIWDSQTGELLTNLNGHSNYVVGLAFSPDGTHLASASWDGSAKVWDLASGTNITTFTGHPTPAIISGLAFHPNGNTLFTGADDKFVRQWDVYTGKEVRTFTSGGKDIYGVAISPDGSLLVAGDQDGNIHLWNVETGEKLSLISGHAGLVFRLVFSHDGARLATAGFDRLAKVWDVQSRREMISLYGNASNIFGVSFSPDGKYLATAGADGSIRLYTLQIDQLIDLVKERLTRNLTSEECQKYLHRGTCP